MSELPNPSKTDEGVGHRARRFSKRNAVMVLVVGIAIVVLAASWLVQLDYQNPFQAPASPYWNGGEWSDPLDVSMNQPAIVEFQGKLFMFFSVVTENTIGDDDVVIKPQEHLL